VVVPNDNPTASLLSAFATYAAGFLVRPFGAVVFGQTGVIVLVLLGLTAGQGVVWYQGQLQALNTGLVGATFPEGSKSYVPFLTNFMALPIKTDISLRMFNPENDPNGNIFLGLGYVIVVALMSVVVGTLFLHEPKNVKTWDEVGGQQEPGVVAGAGAAR
jgi:hypothetical protein